MDDITLGDITAEHVLMLEDVVKAGRETMFVSVVYGRAFRGAMMTNALKLLGIDAPGVFDVATSDDQAAERLDQLLVLNEVVIENKNHEGYPPRERGLYLYKAGELVYFIGIMFPVKDHFVVQTNVPEIK